MTQLDVDQAMHLSQMIFEREGQIAALEDDLEALCREHPQLVELHPELRLQMRQGWDKERVDLNFMSWDLFHGEF